MFSGGCVFVGHASGFIHIEFQCHLNSHETLDAKGHFEDISRDVGVVVQSYHTDNGSAFTSAQYAERLKRS